MDGPRKTSAALTRREFVQGVGTLGLGVAAVRMGESMPAGPQVKTVFFAAQPVWPSGREEEKNLFVGFRAVFEPVADRRITLRAAASTIYRCFVNGKFCGYGPARAAHGYYRVDEWNLTDLLQPGKNVVAFEVAGYNVNSYYLLDQPSFLQAEITGGDKVLAATGSAGNPFEATILRERVQKVQRFSFQRPFSEVYRLGPGYDLWRVDASAALQTVKCDSAPEKRLLPRRVANPQFYLRQPVWVVAEGQVETGFKPEKVWKDRALTDIGPKLKGFTEGELEVIPSVELQYVKTLPGSKTKRLYGLGEKVKLGEKSYATFDFGTNLTGFLGAKVTSHGRTRLFFTFDEVLTSGDVDCKRADCVNIVLYEMPAGTCQVEAFEPYTLRYLKLIVLEGECEVEGVTLREYANPDVERAHFAASDERLNRLFAAGRETYGQNAVDLFTDCPSRERAGWLCDSYFTSRVAPVLSGDTTQEKNFLENFLLPESFACLPKGMLPMCYPADHNDGNFIPNWALWFVLQLEEYLGRSGDRALVEALRPKVLGVFEYFRSFKNEDGLLEKLKGWVFVEWSAANDFVQDVNYPTNMLYAAALEAAAGIYGLTELRDEAERIRGVIRRQSFDGEFFVDNAVRREGKLQVTKNRTEVCQYFAFYFGVATPATHAKLWQVLREQFGPHRKENRLFPEVHEANTLVGNMLRIEILSRAGLGRQILDESISYLLYMAERTGTLWENVGPSASCDHGFASHIVKTLYRDVLGLHDVDTVGRVVHLRFPDVQLDWCEGSVPVGGGRITLAWRKEGSKKLYRIDTPAGYRLELERHDETWVREG
jgi:alpha-L-rhamnosidase